LVEELLNTLNSQELNSQDLNKSWDIFSEIKRNTRASKAAKQADTTYLPRLSDLTIDQAKSVFETTTDRNRAANRAIHVLDPLLKYDPDNVEAKKLLEYIKLKD
jgi:hypothetical protein